MIQDLVVKVCVTARSAEDEVMIWGARGVMGVLSVPTGQGGFLASRLFGDEESDRGMPLRIKLAGDQTWFELSDGED